MSRRGLVAVVGFWLLVAALALGWAIDARLTARALVAAISLAAAVLFGRMASEMVYQLFAR